MLARLIAAFKSKQLPPLDRFNLANDLFALVAAGKTSVTFFTDLLAAAENEDSFIVWQTIDSGVFHIVLS